VTIQIKDLSSNVALFILITTVDLHSFVTLKSLDETLACDHSNESYWAVFSSGTVYYAVKGGSDF